MDIKSRLLSLLFFISVGANQQHFLNLFEFDNIR